MKNNLNHLLPCHTTRLFDASQYSLYSSEDDDALREETLTEEQASNFIEGVCPKFVECASIMDGVCFFITSFCVFVHSKQVDDCADSSLVSVQKKVTAFIRKETRTGSDYFELTVRLSNVELLVEDGNTWRHIRVSRSCYWS
jgi:hypothetical protein